MNVNSMTFIIGTRPECIKMAPLILEAKLRMINCNVVYLTQHHDVVEEIFELFDISDYIRLEVNRNRNSLIDFFSESLKVLDNYLKLLKNTDIFVQGDTATATVGSLVAFYQKRRLHHVEAGLRSGNSNNPFPEEMNRKIISQLSDMNYAPTLTNVNNLLKENIDPSRIFQTGNTIIDSLVYLKNNKKFDNLENHITKFINSHKRIILITAHRREKWGNEYENFLLEIIKIKDYLKNVGIIFVTHPNPYLRNLAIERLENKSSILVLPPQRYDKFISLINNSDLIISDSGGIQEEATYLGKHVFVVRANSERAEGFRGDQLRLVEAHLTEKVIEFISNIEDMNMSVIDSNRYIFGDGTASKKILEIAERDSGE